MIRSFAEKETERLWRTRRSIRFGNLAHRAFQALTEVNNASKVDDLRLPPGNRLEKLRGDREGQWSIRVDRQWRVCFVWENGHAERVEIIDYH